MNIMKKTFVFMIMVKTFCATAKQPAILMNVVVWMDNISISRLLKTGWSFFYRVRPNAALYYWHQNGENISEKIGVEK